MAELLMQQVGCVRRKQKSRRWDGFFDAREKITSSLQLSELLREQRQPSELLQEQQRQPSELLQQEPQPSELQQEQELQLLLSYRKQPGPERAGKRSATIFS